MEIWLIGNATFRLPVLPSTVGLNFESGNTTVNLEQIGEVSFIGFPKLISTTFSDILLPDQEYPFCQYNGFPKALEAFNMLKSMFESRDPIRFVITPVINTLATLESFKPKYKDGTTDIYVDLEIREYKIIQQKVLNTKVNQYSVGRYEEATRIADKPVPPSITCKTGDSALTISKCCFGNASQANNIAKANNLSNPNNIPTGISISLKVSR